MQIWTYANKKAEQTAMAKWNIMNAQKDEDFYSKAKMKRRKEVRKERRKGNFQKASCTKTRLWLGKPCVLEVKEESARLRERHGPWGKGAPLGSSWMWVKREKKRIKNHFWNTGASLGRGRLLRLGVCVGVGVCGCVSFFFFFFVFLVFLWGTPVAYGSSQARGRIGAVATGLHWP